MLDLLPLRRLAVKAFFPIQQDLINFVQLVGVLIVQRVQVVILLRAGDELLQHDLAISGPHEFFQQIRVLPERRIGDHDQQKEDERQKPRIKLTIRVHCSTLRIGSSGYLVG